MLLYDSGGGDRVNLAKNCCPQSGQNGHFILILCSFVALHVTVYLWSDLYGLTMRVLWETPGTPWYSGAHSPHIYGSKSP